jgi:hypothetical protein
MHTRRRFCQLLGGLALGASVGCSPKGSYATISGIVTYNGAPVADARVTFTSTTESNGVRYTFSSVTDTEGKYVVASVGKEPGVPPGAYKVTVTKYRMKPGIQIPEDFDIVQIEASGSGESVLPKEYGSDKTSKLTASLETGKNEKNFDLKGPK